jgi:hypothetical protein
MTAEAGAPGEPFTAIGAQVRDVTFAGSGGGEWELRLRVEHPAGRGRYNGTITCQLRESSDAEGVAVELPFQLGGDSGETELSAPFRIARAWQPGEYPIECRSLRAQRVFVGTITVR